VYKYLRFYYVPKKNQHCLSDEMGRYFQHEYARGKSHALDSIAIKDFRFGHFNCFKGMQ
jgi:hypothetical protein